jgi:hypothetical protein
MVWWSEAKKLPPGWAWMPLQDISQFRLRYARIVGTDEVYRPILKT